MGLAISVGAITDGEVGLFGAEDDLSEKVKLGVPVSASLDGLDPADVAFDGVSRGSLDRNAAYTVAAHLA